MFGVRGVRWIGALPQTPEFTGKMKGRRFAASMGLLRRLGLCRLHVAVPAADQQLLEGGIGGIEGFAAAHIGLAVEIAVIGLVDALHLFAGLTDEGGKTLPVRRERGPEIGL